MIRSFFGKRDFDLNSDRLGPDCPFTHWRLYFKPTMQKICQKKFKFFSDSAEFRSGAYAIACSKISLGSRVIIRPNTMLFADPREGGAGISIEDEVMVGSGVHCYVHNHRFDNASIPIIDQGHYNSQEIILKKGSWVGANAIILSGVTIGENSVVGAGSVVTKDVPARTVYAGNPARFIKKL